MNLGEEHESHHVRRVQLPSGKTIEVVIFSDAPAVERDPDLHLCCSCPSELVYPVAWEEAGESSWRVALRCPDCEQVREGVFGQEVVDAFDEQLDAGTDALAADLRRLTRANMADELARLRAALRADALLPEDF
jgi:hypothetical protein